MRHSDRYGEGGKTRPGPRRHRPDRNKPLWIGVSIPTDEELAPGTEAARKQVVRRYGRGAEIYWWFLNRRDMGKVLPGHNVVLINQVSDRDEPHGNATAWAPAIVARVEPGTARQQPVGYLVSDPDLGGRRFADVKAAVRGAHGTIDWEMPLDAGPVADAVYALWFPA